MGINIGALISPLICGYVGERISWRLGFGVAGLGHAAGTGAVRPGQQASGRRGSASGVARAIRNRIGSRSAARSLAVGGGLGVFALLGVLGATGVIAIYRDVDLGRAGLVCCWGFRWWCSRG